MSDLYASYKVMDSNEGQVVQTIPSLINIDVNENQEPVVSGRELHAKLEVKSKYSDWMNRMLDYGFEENIDYILVTQKKETNNPKNPWTEITDHILKIDMAKEICMLQRNEKGKQFRQYFLQIEKDWNSPEKVMARALLMAQNQLEIKTEKLQIAEEENIKLGQIIESQKPKVEYVDKILSCKDAMLVTNIAFDYGLSAQALNKILCEEKVQRKVRNQYILYSEYMGKGYTETETGEYGGKARPQTLWTQKGRMFIHQILKQRNIKPLEDIIGGK